MALFDTDFLSRLEYLSIVSKRVFSGRLIAQRRARQSGSGIEFSDHREYTIGDDFRYLDWHVYARHEELLLKRFHEEQDLHVYVLVDCSRSMGFGRPVSKFDQARRLAAALAYIALADLDRVSVLGFADGLVRELPMMRGKNRALSLLNFLDSLETRPGTTNLLAASRRLVERNSRRGPAIVLSDLYDPAGYRQGLDLLRYHRFEPAVIHVYDPGEQEPDVLGDVEFIDAESDEGRKVTVTESSLARYRRVYGRFVEGLVGYCRGHGLSLTRAADDVAFDTVVLRMMRATEVVR